MLLKRVEVVPGLVMPFYPMRPTTGRIFRSESSVNEFWEDVVESGRWVVQPKLRGCRACLAVVDGKVHIQNRHGGWFGFTVDASAYLTLPNRTALDGEVYKGRFYPFEALAVNGKPFLRCTTLEREVCAYQLTQQVRERWLFAQPDKRWLLARTKNLPDWEGVVIKQLAAPYVLLGSPAQTSLTWFKRLWKRP